MYIIQGVKGESEKSSSSKFGKNQCLYWNQRYLWWKPSALEWHPEYDCSIKVVFYIEGKKSKNLRTYVKNQENMLFAASRQGNHLIMPHP